ncbi:bifunctional 5,10-methylenetetrahydrofolate dehydrogenase/5,10-methenyltetrahydrofolate cyclohydrolase [Patescibacteria group bacterium]|nr:bifunctional 5,10-methylenetetrahydrofolate dehydrogenase/5,10-methenyltetrahydrofolate cyclohydrolase [Patescibacteria group bacterium]MBU1722083.1 bifunctional 5,10-methylenetetrahydrofolate dehydrogenase/5,10-methenyltetrahydrofolate cyclohydrolase [Patescibacteria group bacterium]MBU1901363.1 bifunctional 5,10-methylenetetrahydrofolate dehydrogenase/5,10-methenyltetrahydrofolate cyclohydrolase [Patescibacteria group bacterium]
MNIINGDLISESILSTNKRQVTQLKKQGITPRLIVVLVGNNKASETYVLKKQHAGKAIGMDVDVVHYPKDISQKELIQNIKNIQKETIDGLMVQLPLPKHLHTGAILNTIHQDVDVDYLSYASLGKLLRGDQDITPPTPGAILHILEKELGLSLAGKQIALVGTGNLVGKPLALLLMNRHASIMTCNQQTKDIKSICRQADIIITAVGKKDLIRKNMIKKGTVVIDAGVCFDKKQMYGDINFKEIAKRASAVTPTPGGVGPITVAKLIENTVLNAQKRKK